MKIICIHLVQKTELPMIQIYCCLTSPGLRCLICKMDVRMPVSQIYEPASDNASYSVPKT